MDHGKLLAVDTPRNLVNQLDASYTVKLTMDNPMTEGQLENLHGRVEVLHSNQEDGAATDDEEINNIQNAYLLRLPNPSALKTLLDEITETGLVLENLQITPVTLEDVFLELTGTELRD